jgi:hypothetical protein
MKFGSNIRAKLVYLNKIFKFPSGQDPSVIQHRFLKRFTVTSLKNMQLFQQFYEEYTITAQSIFNTFPFNCNK